MKGIIKKSTISTLNLTKWRIGKVEHLESKVSAEIEVLKSDLAVE